MSDETGPAQDARVRRDREGATVATAMRKLDGGSKAQGWLVRNEQGETFGPVDFDTLKSWARDGRLAPTNEVSENGSPWVLATSLGALEMNWVAEVTPGTFYGPIHRQAMDELVRDGSISSACARFQRLSSATATAAVAPAAEVQPAQEASPDVVSQLALARERLTALEERLRSAEQRAGAETERADRQRAAYEEQLHAVQQRNAACVAELEFSRASAKALNERVEQAERRAADEAARAGKQQAAFEEQVRLAQQQNVASASELARTREASAALESRLAQSEERAATLDGQLRSAQDLGAASAAELKVALGRVALLETEVERGRQALADQAEHARRQVAACEEQFQLLRQQVADHLGQAARAQACVETLQARAEAAEREAGERGDELKRLREDQVAAASKAAELRAERDAQTLALAAQASAFEAERQEFRAAMGHAQAEAAVRSVRFAQLEKALEGQTATAPELGALEEQVRALGAEVAGLRQALGGEKEIAQQAKARCASLETALEEARARCGQLENLGGLRDDVRRVSQQLEALSGQVAAVQAAASASAERPVRRVEAEPVDVEVLPPDQDHGRSAARGPRKASESHGAGEASDGATTGRARSPAGLSLAELEKQARRELERLGAQGATLFRKK